MELYGYINEDRGLMVISDEINHEAQNSIIKLCTEDEVVAYATKFIREVYQKYKKEHEEKA